MKKKPQLPRDPADVERRARLDQVSSALRVVHKTLIDAARADYEREHEPVAGPLALYQLLTGDPHFQWLRAMSELMARIDEAVDGPEPLERTHLVAFRMEVEGLVTADGAAEDSFAARYVALLQSRHDVLLAHLPLRRALERL